jgi:hypothetical protein
MDPLLANQLRRLWPLVLTLFIAALFMLVHTLVFKPKATRYRDAIARAGAMGLVVDPAHPSDRQMLSVKVYTLLISNSLPADEADARSQSGTLGAQMAQALTRMASRRDLEVLIAEPGTTTQLPGSVEMRAHLRLRGHYPAFVGFVDDLARDSRLWSLERFTITPVNGGSDEFEIWVASCLLKRTGSGS